MSIIERYCPLCERASIDEAYIDITELVNNKIKNNNKDEINSNIDQLTTIDGSSLSQFNSYDNRLKIAASIVYEIRTTVYNELGYTVSGGIASNKFLAKQASSSRKPNKQTLVPLSSIHAMMQEVTLKDLRGLGGKLGEAVKSFLNQQKLKIQPIDSSKTINNTQNKNEIKDSSENLNLYERNLQPKIKDIDVYKASDLQIFEESVLCSKFGEKTGRWLYRVCRGIDDELVKPVMKPKSLLAFKSFKLEDTIGGLEKWMKLLCGDLLMRMTADKQVNNRK
eukprot:CAMPEP_0119049614 /NCGR_PEP_ID=MMETSP1177-20130426/65584_1 /TAXON_ID=2985 /ORGANISM="Ochromonas sp, Strain CCMP1899" /LENGTH=279 /DNA_ID=CAMNT_0007027089 /DNA_START=259 /DNA_END=1095 /DNA_ORIENTATION=+